MRFAIGTLAPDARTHRGGKYVDDTCVHDGVLRMRSCDREAPFGANNRAASVKQ